jgi:hypothetical protein
VSEWRSESSSFSFYIGRHFQLLEILSPVAFEIDQIFVAPRSFRWYIDYMRYLIILAIALCIAAKGAKSLADNLVDQIGKEVAASVQKGIDAGMDSYDVEAIGKGVERHAKAKAAEVKEVADAKVKEVQESDLLGK